MEEYTRLAEFYGTKFRDRFKEVYQRAAETRLKKRLEDFHKDFEHGIRVKFPTLIYIVNFLIDHNNCDKFEMRDWVAGKMIEEIDFVNETSLGLIKSYTTTINALKRYKLIKIRGKEIKLLIDEKHSRELQSTT
ncbi:MAG: hypothetical protein ACUVXA_00670 [Candidatus Jordarchaeum sp.]|uniref:hypothetical protein n=1 Tax=Candidatus Jordarchaeum sp. TaxID=2823881 RepID=UPI0040495B97